MLTRQLVETPRIVGDGVTPIVELVEEQLVAGGGRPANRRKLTRTTQKAVVETFAVMNDGDVLAEDKTLEIRARQSLLSGATTFGLVQPVDPEPEEQAKRIQEALGNDGLTSYTFVQRVDSRGRRQWVVADATATPSLSRFLYPGLGASCDGFPAQARYVLDSERLRGVSRAHL